jgi:hypothetical protein
MPDHHTDLSDQKVAARRRQSSDTGPTAADGSAAQSFLRLQSQVGNAHIARLLAQRAGEEEEELQATHDLTQRAEAEEEEVQAKHETVGVEGGPVGPDTAGRIESMRGGGSSLDTGTRTSMESAFGTNFSDVRVHADGESDALNRRLTARAFTTGSDIFLRRDASPSDTRLLAHELTHVVQQRSMSGGAGGMRVGAAGDNHERHADAVADALTAAPSQAPAPQMAQRAEAEDEEVQAQHDDAVAQRAGEEDEEVQAAHDLTQHEGAEEEEPA